MHRLISVALLNLVIGKSKNLIITVLNISLFPISISIIFLTEEVVLGQKEVIRGCWEGCHLDALDPLASALVSS